MFPVEAFRRTIDKFAPKCVKLHVGKQRSIYFTCEFSEADQAK